MTTAGYTTTVTGTTVTTIPAAVTPSASPASVSTSSVLGTGGIIGVAVGGGCFFIILILLMLYSTKWKCACPSSCGECWKWTRYGNKPASEDDTSSQTPDNLPIADPIDPSVIDHVLDRVFLSTPLSEAYKSNDTTTMIVPGDFIGANDMTETPAMLKISNDKEKIMREFRFMKKLYAQSREHFVEPYALLRGIENQITPCNENERHKCSQYVCIAMEKAEMDMKQYLHENKEMPDNEKLTEIAKLLQIIEAASRAKTVLVDFKPENVVRIYKAGKTYLKAVDFDSACEEGTDILGDITMSYSCPEVAKSMLGQQPRPKVHILT